MQIDLEKQKVLLGQASAECRKLESSAVIPSLPFYYPRWISSYIWHQAPLEKLLKENGLLKTDNEKFQKILKQYEGRKKKLIDTIAYEKTELASRSMCCFLDPHTLLLECSFM